MNCAGLELDTQEVTNYMQPTQLGLSFLLTLLRSANIDFNILQVHHLS